MSKDLEHTFKIRPITPRDDSRMAQIIRTVMPEFGADGPGFAIHDPEVDALANAYQQPMHAYFVVEMDDEVVGGAGIAPLQGADSSICELRKMYFLPVARGKGLGQRMLAHNLEVAKQLGFKQCYLETLIQMTAAQKLYEAFGFMRIPQALGQTGHFGCDRFYIKNL